MRRGRFTGPPAGRGAYRRRPAGWAGSRPVRRPRPSAAAPVTSTSSPPSVDGEKTARRRQSARGDRALQAHPAPAGIRRSASGRAPSGAGPVGALAVSVRLPSAPSTATADPSVARSQHHHADAARPPDKLRDERHWPERRRGRPASRPAPAVRARSRATRSPRSKASSCSWVTSTVVMPTLRITSRISRRVRSRRVGSRFESGSSSRRTRGSGASARARATRCCCPPESCPIRRRSKPRQVHQRQCLGRPGGQLARRGRPRDSRPKATFSPTSRWGKSA